MAYKFIGKMQATTKKQESVVDFITNKTSYIVSYEVDTETDTSVLLCNLDKFKMFHGGTIGKARLRGTGSDTSFVEDTLWSGSVDDFTETEIFMQGLTNGYSNMLCVFGICTDVSDLYCGNNTNTENTSNSPLYYGNRYNFNANRFIGRISNGVTTVYSQNDVGIFKYDLKSGFSEPKPNISFINMVTTVGTTKKLVSYDNFFGYANVTSNYYPTLFSKYITPINNYLSKHPDFLDKLEGLYILTQNERSNTTASIGSGYCSYAPMCEDLEILKTAQTEIVTDFPSNSKEVTFGSTNVRWLEGFLMIKWLFECCENGGIIDETPTDDITHYFYEPSETSGMLTWQNTACDSGDSDYDMSKSYIEIGGCTEIMTGDPVGFNSACSHYSTRIPYNDRAYNIIVKDILEVADKNIYDKLINGFSDLLGTTLLGVYMRGYFADENGVKQQRNACYVRINVKTGEIYDLGQQEITIYTDDISEGSADPVDPTDPNEPDDPDDPDDPITPTDPTYGETGLLTTTYGVTPENLQAIGNILWQDDFMENIKLVNNNPIENIISVKMFPLSITGIAQGIKLGNVATGVTGSKISNATFPKSVTSGTITIPRHFNNFLDYEPYTKIEMYIPFIGFVPLECGLAYNGAISLRWTFDLITGAFTCTLMNSGRVIKIYNGTCGIDIPITGSNRAQLELGYISSAMTAIGSAYSGNAMGVAYSALSSAGATFHSSTIGKPSNSCGVANPMTPYVIIDRPKYDKPSGYGHTYGYPCNKYYKLGNLKGFTKVKNLEFSAPCTDREKEEILQLLESGIYL